MLMFFPSALQCLLVWDTPQLLLDDLLAQAPQILAQFLVLRLFRWVGNFAIRYDLRRSNVSFIDPEKNSSDVEWTHVLPLDSLRHDVIARCCEQCGSATFVHGIFHEGFDSLHPNFAHRPVCVHSLTELIRRDPTWMCCVDPRPVILLALEAGFVVGHASNKGTHEENLGELGTRVQRVGSEIGIDLVEGRKLGGGKRRTVEIGGLEDKAGVGRRLEIGKEGESEKHLGKVVDLEVGVCIQ